MRRTDFNRSETLGLGALESSAPRPITGIPTAPSPGRGCVRPEAGAGGRAGSGGTSLFGGKGKASDAVIGGLVIATIVNGLGLLAQAAYIGYFVTGAVLLLAASVDAISRRRRSATGLG